MSTTLSILCDHFIIFPWIILFCWISLGVLRPHLGQSQTINIIITPPPRTHSIIKHTCVYKTCCAHYIGVISRRLWTQLMECRNTEYIVQFQLCTTKIHNIVEKGNETIFFKISLEFLAKAKVDSYALVLISCTQPPFTDRLLCSRLKLTFLPIWGWLGLSPNVILHFFSK